MAMDFMSAAWHASVFVAMFVPLWIALGILKCYKGKFAKVFILLVLGLLPMALFHFLESLMYFGIEVVPQDHEWLEHLVAVIAVLAVGGFLYWFNAQYVQPLCMFGKKKKRLTISRL